MEIGDLVKIKKPYFIPASEEGRPKEGWCGIIINCEKNDYEVIDYEVLFKNCEIDWFQDLELEVVERTPDEEVQSRINAYRKAIRVDSN